jgi:plasmid stabilization system protein ParE
LASFRVQEAAAYRIDEIHRYTRAHWGEEQADRYITGLFDAFARVATNEVSSHPIPAEFGVEGFVFRYERHLVYWRRLDDGDIGIATILHERMHQVGRLRQDLGL